MARKRLRYCAGSPRNRRRNLYAISYYCHLTSHPGALAAADDVSFMRHPSGLRACSIYTVLSVCTALMTAAAQVVFRWC